MGLRLDGSLPLSGEAHLFSWYLSLTNGNNGRRHSDNDQLAYTGRLQLDHKFSGKLRMSFGGGLRYNEVSRGASLIWSASGASPTPSTGRSRRTGSS